ncbi:hypothetical protein ANANG_G00094070, partial [Anguilla anguilla]
ARAGARTERVQERGCQARVITGFNRRTVLISDRNKLLTAGAETASCSRSRCQTGVGERGTHTRWQTGVGERGTHTRCQTGVGERGTHTRCQTGVGERG